MAVMVAALVVRGFLKDVEDNVASGLAHTWEWSGELMNSVLFVIMGIVITLGMFETHWLAMLIAIGAALVARAIAINMAIYSGLGRPARCYCPRTGLVATNGTGLLVHGAINGVRRGAVQSPRTGHDQHSDY